MNNIDYDKLDNLFKHANASKQKPMTEKQMRFIELIIDKLDYDISESWRKWSCEEASRFIDDNKEWL